MFRTLTKPLTAAAILLATASWTTPTFASNKATVQKKVAAQSSIDPFHVKLLTTKEIQHLSFANQQTYFRSLQNILVALENYHEAGESATQYGVMDFFIAKAFASDKIHSLCPIGGYWGEKHIVNGKLSCGAPSSVPDAPGTPDEKRRFSIWDADPSETGPGKGFFCGGPGAEKTKAYCNSSVFLYGDEGKRFCEPLQNLTANCQKAFETKYNNPSDPNHELLKKDMKRLIAKTKLHPDDQPDLDLDKIYDSTGKVLNTYIGSKKKNFDAGTARTLLGQIGAIQDAKKLADAEPDAATTEEVAGQPALPPPPPPDMAPPPIVVAPVPPVPPAIVAAPVPPGTPTPASVDSDNSAVGNDPADVTADSGTNVLGKELTCVSDGLKSLHYDPSDRYLAFLGTGVQAFSHGGYDVKNSASLQQFQSKVISMVQSFGVCDKDSYPPVEPKEFDQLRKWLTHGRGENKSDGMDFIRETSSPLSSSGSRSDLYAIFGVQAVDISPLTAWWYKIDNKNKTGDQVADGFRQIFDQKSWDSKPLADRQKVFTEFKTYPSYNRAIHLGKCIENDKKLIKADPKLQLDSSEARKPAEVTADNRKVCEAMAKSCSLNVDFTCAPPAAAIGTPGAPSVPFSQ